MKGGKKKLKWAFWGTPDFAVYVLDALAEEGWVPDLMVTAPDKPRGRKLVMTAPEAKQWAEEHFVTTFQPEKLRDPETIAALKEEGPWDVFVVAAYGKLLPQEVLDMPKHGILNVHPSLLPKLRGASPIQSAILEEDETGVSIMVMDEEMDHGPVAAQEKLHFKRWPMKASALERVLGWHGGKLLAHVLDHWPEMHKKAEPQDHDKATFTKKITKEDGLLDLNDDPETNLRKIYAFDIWPRAYFFTQKNDKKMRVVVTDAAIEDGELVIKKVIPEGKKEIGYETFKKSQ